MSNHFKLILKLSFRPGRESDSEAEDIEHAEKLRQVKAVLEEVYFNYTECLDSWLSLMLMYACPFIVKMR